MTFGQRLIEAREAKKMNQKQLAEALGITPTRLNYWEKDKRQPDVSMIQALAETLDVSADFLIGNANRKSPTLSGEALRLAKDYDELDDHGQRTVRVVADEELVRMKEEEPEEETATKKIPLFRQAMAAGPAEPENEQIMAWDYYDVPGESPADFAIHINGTSMEPWLHDGSVALGVRRQPRSGEVAAMSLDGEYLVKQIVQDHLGNFYLLSLNRAESDKDVTIWAGRDTRTLTWIGVILTEKPVPLPQI